MIELAGTLAVHFSGLRVEVERNAEREVWAVPALLRFHDVDNLTLTRQLPSDGEVVIAEIEPRPADLKALLTGLSTSSFRFVFSSGAELKGVATRASLEVGPGGNYIQTCE
ncbi:MAG: hypothetical protein LC659_15325 [Myxococcales bacterium]|nr:hypothetical protein [Myxococcales bacterium]